jgi:outer membrane protein assembly factor BamB
VRGTSRWLAIAIVAGAFASASPAANARARPAAASRDWSTFGYSLERLGRNPFERELTSRRAGRLRRVWHTTVPGAVNTQPLIAHRQLVKGRRVDLVYVGTEHGRVVALDARNGRVVWRRRLASRHLVSGCSPSPDNRFGVTGTLTLDRKARRIYAVDARGRTWALAAGTGRTVRGWPVRITTPGTSEMVWGALALSRGRVYAAIASACDNGEYHGGVVSVAVRRPRRIARWDATGGTALGGAIWGWGGVAIDRRDGDVYAATGNALWPAEETSGFAERVVRLSRRLRVEQSDAPLRAPFAIYDRDFGTTPVLFRVDGCPRQLVVLNKTGELFLYDRDRLGEGPRQRLQVAAVREGAVPLIGLPAVDPSSRTLVLLTPADSPAAGVRRGIVALRMTASCRLAIRWQQELDPPASGSPPTIAGGVVYVGSGRTGRLRAYSLADGRRRWARRLAASPVFAAPTVVDGTVYAADWDGGVWAFRPRR